MREWYRKSVKNLNKDNRWKAKILKKQLKNKTQTHYVCQAKDDFVFERYRDRNFTEKQLICIRSTRKQTCSEQRMDPIVHFRKHSIISELSVQSKYNWYGDVTLINLYNQTWLLKIIFKSPSKFWNRPVIANTLSWFICTSIETETKIPRHIIFANQYYQ